MLVRRLTCPSCGAPLELAGENSPVTCAYCSTSLLVERDRVYRQPAPPPAAAPVVRQPAVSSAANASLIFGCVAWFLVPVMGALAAVVLGHAARREIASANGRVTGGTRALVGLTLGYMQLGLLALGIVLYAVKGPAG
jgi:DNA-directed RNA polymerase subunit RPC12/RpoP